MATKKSSLQDRILDTALEQAEASSWEQLRLHTVAETLGISLDDIRQHYPEKDDLVEAWFDRADRALLGGDRPADFPDRSLPERLHHVISSWLDALAPHRRLSRQMLAYKLEFGHVHLQALGLMRISRTVQWFMEAAHYDRTGLQRIFDECALTTIYLTSFARWLFDDSEHGMKSKEALKSALRQWHAYSCQNRGCAGETTVTEPEPEQPQPDT